VGPALKELDYDKLKKTLGFFVDRYFPQDILTTESHPVCVLEQWEKTMRPTAVRRALMSGIGDVVEMSEDFSESMIEKADAELDKIDAYTLTFLRSRFARKRKW
jgi:hypothetical protein